MKRRKPTAKQYDQALVSLAITYSPPIRPCPDCGWPKAEGYICIYCDETYADRGRGAVVDPKEGL
jgi:hypothetical protein